MHQGNDDEILKKQQEAEQVLQEARAAAQKEIQTAKAEAQEKQAKRLAEVKAVRGLLPPALVGPLSFGHVCIQFRVVRTEV